MSSSSPRKLSASALAPAAKKLKTSSLLRFFRTPFLSEHATSTLQAQWADVLTSVETEICFYIELEASASALTTEEEQCLTWLLSETFEPKQYRSTSFLAPSAAAAAWHVEVGPRMNFSTPWSSNAVSICHACGLTKIKRIERSRVFLFHAKPGKLTADFKTKFLAAHMDRMTEQVYETPLTEFGVFTTPKPVQRIPIMTEGKEALRRVNEENGLGFDEWDLEYYTNLFKEKLKRDPTDVECFDMGQSNSEHSRHWFFGGKIVLDGQEMPETLFKMVKSTLTPASMKNSIIAFHDNSSVIKGAKIKTLAPANVGGPSALAERNLESHVLLTAETHNFPSGVAPFPGAETGTGGRIRDVQATGRGAHVVAGVSAYSVGQLCLEDYDLPWEDKALQYPSNLAHPRDIIVQASNGASDYGNKFGEPVVTGFARSFGMVLPNGERREYIKPIMFSAGVGQLNATHCTKGHAEVNMWVVKVGGPCYRIGMGGGAASSRIQDAKTAELDFNAVQRGDAEMENKMNRVIRACIELGDKNPIVSIHDQGAGGNGNVLKEIVEPAGEHRGGARYEVRNILVGDDTLSVLEIWGAEYQENNALLLRPADVDLFSRICARENCPFALLGQVTGDGKVVLHDALDDSTPVDLELDLVLGKMPQKTFTDARLPLPGQELVFPADISVASALDRVLRLLSVGSKRFLTNKVDRCVTGLVAQQPCVGPLQLPLANVSVIAQSHFRSPETGTFTGCASAVGEQPVKGLVNPGAMARLTVGESLTNLVWACLTGSLLDIKCSANWMWAAKLPGEAARMYECCSAMTAFMKDIGVAVDGGKDSLSMAAKVGSENVKAPGTLVVTMYGAVSDVEKTVTPDLKRDGGDLFYIDLGGGKHRLGGSALAQVYAQIGKVVPDMEDATLFAAAFTTLQSCVHNQWLSAGHDRSDGGLLVALLEMAFAGNVGVAIDIPAGVGATVRDHLGVLFAEELGMVVQVPKAFEKDVKAAFAKAHVPFVKVGSLVADGSVSVSIDGHVVLTDSMVALRDTWEATSFALEKRQRRPDVVAQEQANLKHRKTPSWKLTFTPSPTLPKALTTRHEHRIAVLREEGSNGDREMSSAFYLAGFEVWDVTMKDLVSGKVALDDRFRGVAFVGGFSFADVLGSAKGWAGVVKYHPNVLAQFKAFRARDDTFSLGVCNGCQFMSLLGWVNPPVTAELEAANTIEGDLNPRFIDNACEKYVCNFVSVQIQESNAIMLKGMAGSSLGVWVAHGEGRAHFPHPRLLEDVLDKKLAPIRYVNDHNEITSEYPFCPNGSPEGIAGLASADGRHFCMMPHPERAFLKFQWPYQTPEIEHAKVSPWLQMFQNAKAFCESTN
ncbi:phosphoribosylformylglycinamidine synthase [Saprolegnia parasitica CBS 223.65]|uniref:phosphoribosylformylglycinamidine synthase n=1 Tax=Saprolegnia parasitica (strain CBS 223.65) TaxID=695850 RepID=A0A067C2E5_SAPPC|nr:phosphoribosylformylglycinamidine synthase [Saprolegnia parasitica CBS 223.65]KDO20696.1 phosphoribosylformylglycinamidine synthase [Saprolegnia parasitica CBS 223.65]|eukprot:XP_012208580.1 phosphoribosylformylglycinamidine synthase [Saprolegnia parasitica CBS 223.65]